MGEINNCESCGEVKRTVTIDTYKKAKSFFEGDNTYQYFSVNSLSKTWNIDSPGVKRCCDELVDEGIIQKVIGKKGTRYKKKEKPGEPSRIFEEAPKKIEDKPRFPHGAKLGSEGEVSKLGG